MAGAETGALQWRTAATALQQTLSGNTSRVPTLTSVGLNLTRAIKMPLALIPRGRMNVTVGLDIRAMVVSALGRVTPRVRRKARVVLLTTRVSVT